MKKINAYVIIWYNYNGDKMNKLDYHKMMRYLKKHNIKKISYDLFLKFQIETIDYNKLFEELNNYTNFSLISVDDFIKINKELMFQYNNNIIFQYCYKLLSNYQFNSKEQLINAFSTIHTLLLNNRYDQIDKLLNSFTKICKNNNELNMISRKVNNFINNSKYIDYINEILNSQTNIGNLEYSNISETQNIIANTLKMLFVHKGDVDLGNFLSSVKTMTINNYSIDLLKQKYQNSKQDFFNHMLNYYNNRYFYHGTNSKWLNQCRKMGLNGIRINDYQQEIIKVTNLFESYDIYKVFEGRSKELRGFQYYITDSIDSAVYYAHQSPEYFSRFCANGYCMKLLDECDHEAFWRRDYKVCLDNVQKLCKSINMRKDDTLAIINLFNILWKKEVKKRQHPIIFIGKMNDINQNNNNFNQIKQNIENYSFETIYDIFTTPSQIHNKRYATISNDFLSVLHIPNLYKLYQIKSSNFSKEQYIIYNKIKYYPDIIIINEYYKNLYFILKDIDKIQKVSDTIYYIPNKHERLNTNINDEFYIQNLEYLILTNGKGITENGKKFISNSNVEFDDVYTYYQFLTNKLVNEYCKSSQIEEKIKLYHIIANNIFHNLYIMNKTNKLSIFVDCGYKSKLHYDYDTNNYWYKSQAENNVSTKILDTIMKEIKNIFTKL